MCRTPTIRYRAAEKEVREYSLPKWDDVWRLLSPASRNSPVSRKRTKLPMGSVGTDGSGFFL